MLFISSEDFFSKVKNISPLTREEERDLAIRKNGDDTAAQQRLVEKHLPFVSAFVRHAPNYIQTLNTVYACIDCLEKSVDQFNFLQNCETFTHYLGKRLRQCITQCICERY